MTAIPYPVLQETDSSTPKSCDFESASGSTIASNPPQSTPFSPPSPSISGPLLAANSQRFPTYFSLDVTAFKTFDLFGRKIDLGLQVFNLTKHFKRDPWADLDKVRQKLPEAAKRRR